MGQGQIDRQGSRESPQPQEGAAKASEAPGEVRNSEIKTMTDTWHDHTPGCPVSRDADASCECREPTMLCDDDVRATDAWKRRHFPAIPAPVEGDGDASELLETTLCNEANSERPFDGWRPDALRLLSSDTLAELTRLKAAISELTEDNERLKGLNEELAGALEMHEFEAAVAAGDLPEFAEPASPIVRGLKDAIDSNVKTEQVFPAEAINGGTGDYKV